MKTIEEKAKAYDEALERAKQIRNGNPSSGTAIVVCEQIFPELSESEDERIRKWIVAEIKHQYLVDGKKIYCEEAKDALAYLERQKEQVTDESDKIAAAYQLGRSDERKQKEQKPAEWSEEDEKMISSIIMFLAAFMGNEEKIDFLKSIRPHWKPSEAQTEALKGAVEFIRLEKEDSPVATVLESLLKQLESL